MVKEYLIGPCTPECEPFIAIYRGDGKDDFQADIPIKEKESIAREAKIVRKILREVQKEYNLPESIALEPFILHKERKLIPMYSYKVTDVLHLPPNCSDKTIRHEAAHMAHRRALEYIISKDEISIENFEELPNNLGLLVKILHYFNKDADDLTLADNPNRYIYKGKVQSAQALDKLFKADARFCEQFANRRASYGNAEAIPSGINLSLGSYLLYLAAEVAQNANDMQDYVPVGLLGLIGAATAKYGGQILYDLARVQKEKGILPSYITAEAI